MLKNLVTFTWGALVAIKHSSPPVWAPYSIMLTTFSQASQLKTTTHSQVFVCNSNNFVLTVYHVLTFNLAQPTPLPYMSSSVAGVISTTQTTPSFQLFSSSTTIHVSSFHASSTSSSSFSSSSFFTLLQATPAATCEWQACLKFIIARFGFTNYNWYMVFPMQHHHNTVKWLVSLVDIICK